MDTSYLSQQVTTIIGQLHNLFDEIGIPHNERDARESDLFSSLSETLQNHLRLITTEKHDLIEEAKRTVSTIQQMEASLDDAHSTKHGTQYDEDLQITYPLTDCLRALKEKHRSVSRLHQERYEQVKKLVQALQSYSSHLEPSFVQIRLPPLSSTDSLLPTFDLSPAYIASVDREFTRVYEEYERRVAVVQQTAQEMVKLWAELGTPQAQTDSTIVESWRDAPEQLGLHQDDLNKLRARKEKLGEEKRVREKKLKDLKVIVEALWDRLGVDEPDRKAFQAGNRGCGLRAVNDLEDELSRLNELKRQNLHLFVEDARNGLHVLWDELYFSEEEAVEFTPMFCDVFSDALLSAHECEITRLETLKEQRAPTLELIAKHRSLIKDREDLVASSQDASRLMLKPQKGERRDPTRLLREEKMRKRIAKDLPKVEADLIRVLELWEADYGRPFLVFGERYLDTLEDTSTNAPPPRSKTPNGLPPRSKTPSALVPAVPSTQPRSTKPVQPASRMGTVREPIVRSKTPAPSTNSHSIFVPKSIVNSKSPSRLPSRVPLGSIPHGSNSPERAQRQDGTLRKNIGTLMAPPPKLRDLHQPPVIATPSTTSTVDFSRSGSVVRHIQPEDPYSEQSQPPNTYLDSSVLRAYDRAQTNIRSMPPPPRPDYRQDRYDFPDTASVVSGRSRPMTSTAASSIVARQISTTSSAATQETVYSNSENWETYDDDESIMVEAHAPPPRPRNTMRTQVAVLENEKEITPYSSKLRPPYVKPVVVENGYEYNATEDNDYPTHLQTSGILPSTEMKPTGFTGVMGRVQQNMQPPKRYPLIASTRLNDDET